MYLQGCPVDQCRTSQKYNQKITEGTCDEKTAEELRNFTPWVSWVSDLHRFANATGPEHQNQQIAQVVANAMWENGCDFKGYLNSRSIPWGDCFEWSALFDWGFKNMAFFCPTTCGCNAMAVSEQDNLCPIPHAGGCAHATSSNPPVPGGPGGPSRPEGSPPTPGDPPSPPLWMWRCFTSAIRLLGLDNNKLDGIYREIRDKPVFIQGASLNEKPSPTAGAHMSNFQNLRNRRYYISYFRRSYSQKDSTTTLTYHDQRTLVSHWDHQFSPNPQER